MTERLRANLLPRDGGRSIIERTPPPGRPRAAICSLATGWHRQLLAETAPTLAAYAQHHGWSLVLSSEILGDRPPSWTKITLIQQLLEEYEFVLWVDADAIIVDLGRDLLAEITDDADIWFARHPQERDPEATVLNAGVFLVRSSDFTKRLLAAVWANDRFIDHNWWENAALLDLLGYTLEAPFPKVRSSEWDERIGELDLAWNSVPGYCESDYPAINHHARSDHDDFNRRVASLAADRLTAMSKFPQLFSNLRSPSSAGVDGGPRRTHDFDGLKLGQAPTVDELLMVIDRLDADNESQRLRLTAAFDQLEVAVTDLVAAERRNDELAAQLSMADGQHRAEATQLRAEIAAMENTKLFRIARPLRMMYGRVLRRIRA